MASRTPRIDTESPTKTFPLALNDAARGWRSKLDERLRPMGLSSAMWAVLRCLAESPTPLTQRELAEMVGVEGPTLVRLLDRLEEGGWARRKADPGDRRVNRVELAEKALPRYERLSRAGVELSLELLRGIPTEDIETARKVLSTIRERLERPESSPPLQASVADDIYAAETAVGG
jgi:MarR family transcriptional regulator, transcriptional regulator for hemolysin